MRPLILLALVGCEPEPTPSSDLPASSWSRTAAADTADTGALPLVEQLDDDCPLDPDKDSPGLCGCDWLDVDVDDDGFDETCVHREATVLGSLEVGATVYAGALISEGAQVLTDAIIGENAIVAPQATVGERTEIGASSVISRGATLGADSIFGANTLIGREVVIGPDAQADAGSLSVGYASRIGVGLSVLGPMVTIGNRVTLGDHVSLGTEVVIGRGGIVGDRVELGDRTVLGPGAVVESFAELGTGVRTRRSSVVAEGARLANGVRIGREAQVGAYAEVGEWVSLRRGATVRPDASLIDGVELIRDEVVAPVDRLQDRPPTVAITSPLSGADASSSTVLVTGTALDDVGLASVTVRVDDGARRAVSVRDGGFSATMDVSAGSHSITVVAVDTSGQVSVDSVSIDTCVSSEGFDTVWTGQLSADWDTAGNWSPGVPTPTDRVLICANVPTQPSLSTDVRVVDLSMSAAATLDLGGRTLGVSGSLQAGIVVDGTAVVTGTGNVRGVLPDLTVEGQYELSADLTIAGELSIAPSASLNVGVSELYVAGDFVQTLTSPSTGLILRSGESRVDVRGQTRFSGTAQMGDEQLSGGVLAVGGDFIVDNTDVGVFRAKRTRVVFNASSDQTIELGASSPQTSFFGDVDIEAGEVVTVSSEWFVAGDVYVDAGSWVTLADAHIGGNLTVASAGRVYGNGEQRLAVDGRIRGAEDASIDTLTSLAVSRFLPDFAGTLDVGSLILTGDVRAIADWTGDFSEVRVVDGGGLDLGGHTVQILGDFDHVPTAPGWGLRMSGSSVLEVEGDVHFGGSQPMDASSLTGGEVYARSGFSVDPTDVAVFAPTGTTVVFDGAETVVDMPDSQADGNRFYNVRVATGRHRISLGTDAPLHIANDLAVVADAVALVGDVVAGGDVRVGGLAELEHAEGGTLSVGGSLLCASTRVCQLRQVDMFSELPHLGRGGVAERVRIVGPVLMNEDRTLEVGLLYVDFGGRLNVNGHTLTVDGSFRTSRDQDRDGTYLRAGSTLIVEGDSLFSGSVDMAGTWDGGVARFRGGILVGQTNGFQLDGSTVYLDGTSRQLINILGMSLDRARFGTLVIENPAGVEFGESGGIAAVGDLIVQSSSFEAQQGAVLGDVDVIDSALTVRGRFNTQPLEIGGRFTADSTSVLDIGQISVTNHLPQLELPGVDMVTVPGPLVMTEDVAVNTPTLEVLGGLVVGTHSLDVTGALRIRASGSLSTQAGSRVSAQQVLLAPRSQQLGTLAGGTLFVQDLLSTGEDSGFDGSALRVVFDGPGGAASLSQDDPLNQPLGELVVSAGMEVYVQSLQGMNAAGVTLADEAILHADGGVIGNLTMGRNTRLDAYDSRGLRIDGTVVLGVDAMTDIRSLRFGGSLSNLPEALSYDEVLVRDETVTLRERTRVNGDLRIIDGGRLLLAGNDLDIQGQLDDAATERSDGLWMANGDSVSVRADAVFSAANTQLTGGTLSVAGDFVGQPFRSQGTAVVFNGGGTQTVTLDAPSDTDDRFADVTIAAGSDVVFPAVPGAYYLADLVVNGDVSFSRPSYVDSLSVAPGGRLNLQYDMVVAGSCTMLGTANDNPCD